VAVQVGLEVVQLVRVGLLAEDGGAVVGLERLADGVGVVVEVEHEGILLRGMGAVETREGLHRLYAGERLVHVHGVQQGFVVAGLELVGDDEEAVRGLAEPVGNLVGREAV